MPSCDGLSQPWHLTSDEQSAFQRPPWSCWPTRSPPARPPPSQSGPDCFVSSGPRRTPVNGNVALITDPKPSGRAGFVRSKPGTPHGPLSSVFMGISLSQTWAFEIED